MEATEGHIRLRWLLTVVVVGLGVSLLQFWWNNATSSDPTVLLPAADEASITIVPSPAPSPIGVDVIGAVQRPGLYFLQAGARASDAIAAAGGLAPNADRDAVNLASRLRDEQQLRVPKVGEGAVAPAAVASAVPVSSVATSTAPVMARATSSALIDLNTADAATLETLPGIGPVTAQQIVAHRARNGLFRTIDQLDDVHGIGTATIETLRPLVTVDPLP